MEIAHTLNHALKLYKASPLVSRGAGEGFQQLSNVLHRTALSTNRYYFEHIMALLMLIFTGKFSVSLRSWAARGRDPSMRKWVTSLSARTLTRVAWRWSARWRLAKSRTPQSSVSTNTSLTCSPTRRFHSLVRR